MGGRSSEHVISVASARSVIDALDPDRYDVRAVEIRERLFFGVASAVRALVLMLDVEKVVLGGGLASYGEPLVDGTRRYLAEWSARSAFLASLAVADRIELLDPEVPIAALGAADLGEQGSEAHG